MLNCGQNMQLWAPDPESPARTYRDLIVRDKDIVKVVLLLTGSIEGEHLFPCPAIIRGTVVGRTNISACAQVPRRT